MGVEIGMANVSATCTTDCRNSSALIDFQAARSSTLSDSFFQNVILENSSPKPSDLALRFVIIQYIGFAPRIISWCDRSSFILLTYDVKRLTSWRGLIRHNPCLYGSRQPKEGRLDGKSAARLFVLETTDTGFRSSLT